MYCAPELIFDGTDRVGSRFHVLRARTRFRRYEVRRVPFTCFARPDSFSAVPRAAVPFSCFALPDLFPAVPKVSGPDYMFCALGLIFGGVVCVESLFHVLRACSRFKGYRGVESRIHLLCAGTRFRRYRGRQILFSCFARPHSFSAVPRASGLVLMFCSLGLVFDCIEDVGSRFHVLHSLTRFLVMRARIHFRR
jgi:hypothetical protein